MKPRRIVVLFATLLLAAGLAAQRKPSPGFDSLRVLVGEWEGKTESGKAVQVSYQLVSGGSALVETVQPAGEPEMLTVYTADGDRVAVTHYCSANNQPQMRTVPISGPAKQFNFAFVSAGNLAKPSDGHMHALALTLEDSDHFTQKWTWAQDGQEHTEVFHFTRKK